MKEKTFAILKPDVLKRGVHDNIIERIEKANFKILKAKIDTLNGEIVDEHYAHVKDKPFYPEMKEYMTSGPVIFLVLEKENAISDFRKLIGSTKDPEVGTIRYDFRESESKNSIHASDSEEAVKTEIKRFFPEFDPEE